MNCLKVKECACIKQSCKNHELCCQCVEKYRKTDSLPYCLFLDNEGDKSVANYYKKLKERFEKEKMCEK
ncbi:hypothetical protein [Phascolarctobacterium sp.]